jgi:hypothetical protein
VELKNFAHTQFLLVFSMPYVVEIKQKEKHLPWMEGMENKQSLEDTIFFQNKSHGF